MKKFLKIFIVVIIILLVIGAVIFGMSNSKKKDENTLVNTERTKFYKTSENTTFE